MWRFEYSYQSSCPSRQISDRLIHLHWLLQQFINQSNRNFIDENIHQHAKLVLRAFFIYMIFVSNVLVVAVLTQSQHNFLIANTYEYHLIKARFSVKATRLERDIQYNPYRNARDKYRNAFMINFNQIATFDDVGYLLKNNEKTYFKYILDLAIYE